MGSSTSRTLNLKNVNEHYANCDILGNKSTCLAIKFALFTVKYNV